MAVAGDTASRFGSADAEIRVSKPVTLLPAFPRFLALGDRASFGAVVTNTLPTGGDATVTIRSLDPAMLQFGGATTAHRAARRRRARTPVRFDATARGVGSARVQMTVALGSEHRRVRDDAAGRSRRRGSKRRRRSARPTGRAVERLAMPPASCRRPAGSTSTSRRRRSSDSAKARAISRTTRTAAPSRRRRPRWRWRSPPISAARSSMGRIAPADYRTRATRCSTSCRATSAATAASATGPDCSLGQRLSHELRAARHARRRTRSASRRTQNVVARALDFLEARAEAGHRRAGAVAAGLERVGRRSAPRCSPSTAAIRTRTSRASPAWPIGCRSSRCRTWPMRWRRRRRGSALRRRRPPAHERDAGRRRSRARRGDRLGRARAGSGTRTSARRRSCSTASSRAATTRSSCPASCAGCCRRARTAAGATRRRTRPRSRRSSRYYKKFEAETPNMTATVAIGDAHDRQRDVPRPHRRRRSTVRLAMPDLLQAGRRPAPKPTSRSRAPGPAGCTTRRGCSTSPSTPPPPSDQGMRVERRYERFVENGDSSRPATTFAAGDLIRVTLTITLPQERRFVAVTDALPAASRPSTAGSATTASDLARDASSQPADRSFDARWRRGGFDHVEKYDDRVVALRDAAERRPPRVLVSRARDDGRHVHVDRHLGRGDVRAGSVNGRGRRRPRSSIK